MYGSSEQDAKGFTLLEMVVTIALIGFLAALALPAYQDALRTGRRGEAKAELMRLAQSQAKWRLSHKQYATLGELGGAMASEDYQYAVTNISATAFTITATPTSQHGQDGDICGTLSMTHEVVLTSNQSACPKP